MSMYDCAVCSAPRCEHVIEEIDDLNEQIIKLKKRLNASRIMKTLDRDKKTIAKTGGHLLAHSIISFAHDYVKYEYQNDWEPKTKEITVAALSEHGLLGERISGIIRRYEKYAIAVLRVAGFVMTNKVVKIDEKRTSTRVWTFGKHIKGDSVSEIAERYMERVGVPVLKDEEL